MGQGLYTIVGALPRGSDNQTVLALREDGRERQGLVLRPRLPDSQPVKPPNMPGLVPVLGFDEVDGAQYVLYEFVPSVTLREVFEAFKATQRRAPLGLAGRVVLDAARVISTLHTGAQPVVHGSLQDGAVLVSFEGTTRLIDVGSGRRSRFDAPEVEKGEAPTARSDVYSLAAMMHAAATGFASTYAPVAVRGPASADLPPPSKHHADATPEIDACVFRGLATNPAVRAASARLFADELEKALGSKLYSRDQVGATLSELFGDRVAALKSLVARAAQDTKPPTAPRPSRPKVGEQPTGPRTSAPPRPRPSAPAPKVIPGSNIPVDTQAGQGGGIVIEPQVVLVETAADPTTRPPRARPSNPGTAAVGKRASRPDNQAIARPGPPVAERPPPVPLEDESPATGVEPVYKPSGATVESVPHLPPPVPSESEQDLGPVSIGNDPEADSGALGADDPNPTAIRPRPGLTNIPRTSSVELKQQSEEEKAAAEGQEKISTADLDPDNLGELGALQDGAPIEAENTNVKHRPPAPPGRQELDADDGDHGTVTKKPQKKKGGGAGRIFFLFILLLGVFGGLSFKLRPWRGKPIPAWVPPPVAKLLVDDGALAPDGQPMEVVQITDDQAAAEAQADGGVAEEASVDGGVAAVAPTVPPVAAVPVAAAADAGAAAAAAPDAGVGPASAIAAAKADAGQSADAGAKVPPAEHPDKKGKKHKKR